MARQSMHTRQHWEDVYRARAPERQSWFQPRPVGSLRMIAAAGLGPGARVIDVGGGASRLAACLLDLGYRRLAVLDLSAAALAQAQAALGGRAAAVEWIQADVTAFTPAPRFDLWHDRAAFHFLTQPAARRGYVAALRHALGNGGQAVLATFAPNGPGRCSGLAVVRYDAAALSAALGPGFELLEQAGELHRTPANAAQHFNYFRYRFHPPPLTRQ